MVLKRRFAHLPFAYLLPRRENVAIQCRTTPINEGDYITFAEGQSGVKFTPTADSNTAGGFDVESSEDGSTVALEDVAACFECALSSTPTAIVCPPDSTTWTFRFA